MEGIKLISDWFTGNNASSKTTGTIPIETIPIEDDEMYASGDYENESGMIFEAKQDITNKINDVELETVTEPIVEVVIDSVEDSIENPIIDPNSTQVIPIENPVIDPNSTPVIPIEIPLPIEPPSHIWEYGIAGLLIVTAAVIIGSTRAR